jgi:hypothetical protein
MNISGRNFEDKHNLNCMRHHFLVTGIVYYRVTSLSPPSLLLYKEHKTIEIDILRYTVHNLLSSDM